MTDNRGKTEQGRMRRQGRTLALTVAALVVVVVAGCVDDDDPDPTTTTNGTTVTSDGGDDATTTTGVGTGTTDDGGSDTGGDATGTTDGGGDQGDALPGEPWDGFASAGETLSVLGVAHDDVLNIRAVPGTGGGIVATADPTADDLVATGEARQLDGSFWYEVSVDGTTGWANVGFLAFEGDTDDATAAYLAGNGGAIPTAETMVQMADLVASWFASTDPPSGIVQSVAPTVGDLGEISYDVVGIGDDSTAGYRLHIFATPLDSGEGFSLRTIERTTFCARGSDDGLCV